MRNKCENPFLSDVLELLLSAGRRVVKLAPGVNLVGPSCCMKGVAMICRFLRISAKSSSVSVGSVRAPKSTSGLSNILVELILMVPRLQRCAQLQLYA